MYDNIAQPFWFEREITEKLLKESELELRKKLSKEEWYFITNMNKKEKSKNRTIEIKKDIYDLTEREREVLRELARGSTNKQIAEELCISLATVKSHIINLYGKLGVNNRVAAVNRGEMYFK